MRAFTAVLVGVCVLVLGLSAWWNHRDTASGPQQQTENATARSNYYMKDATVYQLSPQGALTYRMEIKESLHFPDNSVQFTDIHVHYLENTASFWNLQANKGYIPPGKKNLLYLEGDVRMQHPRANGVVARATTPHAWVRPDLNQVDTEAPVKAWEPGETVTGTGMRIDLNSNKLYLLKDVHVSYN